jgi:hypothetical protein
LQLSRAVRGEASIHNDEGPSWCRSHAGHGARRRCELLLPPARGDATEGAVKLADDVGRGDRELLPHDLG